MHPSTVILRRDENQALALGQFALDFLQGRLGQPGPAALAKVEQFHLDSVGCAVSALALGANAPRVLRREALESASAIAAMGATCFGSSLRVPPEKAVLANCSAVREWDANGTNFGYNPATGTGCGEFGHNDFYPVVVAAAQAFRLDGQTALTGMLLLDEIRGRLAEAFSLRKHKIDHVLHGSIASAVVYGALAGTSPEQIESAVGMVVAHYVPFRAIRAGHQLSDSKGASAALSAEAAVASIRRSMHGFVGPADIFRNPQALFCLFEPPARAGDSPFDLELTCSGDDFAVMGMHFKLGLYEHQSAGAIEGIIALCSHHPELLADPEDVREIRITIYEPAFSIIADPAKRDPRTRQSADHSLAYIVATLLRKAFAAGRAGWRELMLLPADYDDVNLFDPLTRSLMARVDFRHGGPEYDAKYPDGIPTTVEIHHARLGWVSSGLVMYPTGHARCRGGAIEELLPYKFDRLAEAAVNDVAALRERFSNLAANSAAAMADLLDFPIRGLDDARPG